MGGRGAGAGSTLFRIDRAAEGNGELGLQRQIGKAFLLKSDAITVLLARPEPRPDRVRQAHHLLIAFANAADLVTDHAFATLLSKRRYSGLQPPCIRDREPQTFSKDGARIGLVVVGQHPLGDRAKCFIIEF